MRAVRYARGIMALFGLEYASCVQSVPGCMIYDDAGGGRARLWRPPDWLQGRPLPPPRWRGDRCILLGHGGSSSSSNRSSISLLTAIITAITVINVVVATFLLQRVFKERLRHGCGLLDVSVAGAAACGAGGTKVEREVAQRGGKL